jgi:hypothetical protein
MHLKVLQQTNKLSTKLPDHKKNCLLYFSFRIVFYVEYLINQGIFFGHNLPKRLYKNIYEKTQERWVSGLNQQFAKLPKGVILSVGSNPTFSAIKVINV